MRREKRALSESAKSHVNAFVVFCLATEGVLIGFDLTADEFRYVERFHQAVVVAFLLLRQDERFVRSAVDVDISDERLSIEAVVSAAAEDHPTTVAAP